LDEDPSLDVYFEWTHPCSGWQQQPKIQLEENLKKRGIAWESCRLDGCNYGMMDSKNEFFLNKKWLVKTTDEIFWKNFRAKVCPRNHQHSLIQGLETSRTAYYPRRMVESIVRHWKRQLVPLRHLKLLISKTDVRCDEDENWERRLHPAVLQDGPHLPLQDPTLNETMAASSPGGEHDGQLVPVPAEDHEGQLEPSPDVIDPLDGVSQKDQDVWQARLYHYHRAAGHPTNKNLVHLFRDAGLEPWKLHMAKNFKCEACESIKPGRSSSGNVPPAAT
jgi:hypothetical protein